MKTQLEINSKTYKLERYPKTTDSSLRAWSNAELLALDYIRTKKITKAHLFNDRFGIWNCVLHEKKTITIWTYASQKKAITHNLQLNNFENNINFKTPLDNLQNVELALIKIPKSLELFELFLGQIHKASSEKTEIVCCFMTKYFSVSFLKIATTYFEEVEQSKAWKKARLLMLKKPKKQSLRTYINTIEWKNQQLKQYYGVFSSDKIDIGTQFLLRNFQSKPNELNVLDVASGNGIIAYEIARQNPQVKLTLIDDFNLAVESSKINIENQKAQFICNDNLSSLDINSFDLVVSNPPFHFEHENNIEVSLTLFKKVQKCLRKNGRFVLVANKHLNYKTHLRSFFQTVKELAQNKKFVVYECCLSS